MAQNFSRALRRQVSFVHLAQTARSVLLSYDSVSRMINDLRKIDFGLIMSKAMFLLGNEDIPTKTKTCKYYKGGELTRCTTSTYIFQNTFPVLFTLNTCLQIL